MQHRCHQLYDEFRICFPIRIPPFLHPDDIIARGARVATDLGRPRTLDCTLEGVSAWGGSKVVLCDGKT